MNNNLYSRQAAWVDSSQYWAIQSDQFIRLNIQMLGNAELPLIAMEAQIARLLVKGKNDLPTSLLLTQHGASAAYWMLGFYELLRLLRDKHSDKFHQLSNIFRRVSVIRMPLAKHEVIGAPGYRSIQHYPTSIWCPTTGKVGWSAFEPETNAMIEIYRAELADEFLAIEKV